MKIQELVDVLESMHEEAHTLGVAGSQLYFYSDCEYLIVRLSEKNSKGFTVSLERLISL